MRKLITMLLIAAMLLPAAALAEESDPIVGYWYLYIDIDLYPEMAGAYNGKDYIIDLYHFMGDGTITGAVIEQTGREGTATFHPVGKWQKEDNHYIISIFGAGNADLHIKNGLLYFNLKPLNGVDSYIVLRSMTALNPYSEIVYSLD